jgi:hypothetical protein
VWVKTFKNNCVKYACKKFIKDYTDEADVVFKEEFILKIAILAEKFADNL